MRGACCVLWGAPCQKGGGAHRPALKSTASTRVGDRVEHHAPLRPPLRPPLSSKRQHRQTRHQIARVGRGNRRIAAPAGRGHCAQVQRLASRDHRRSPRKVLFSAHIALWHTAVLYIKPFVSETAELLLRLCQFGSDKATVQNSCFCTRTFTHVCTHMHVRAQIHADSTHVHAHTGTWSMNAYFRTHIRTNANTPLTCYTCKHIHEHTREHACTGVHTMCINPPPSHTHTPLRVRCSGTKSSQTAVVEEALLREECSAAEEEEGEGARAARAGPHPHAPWQIAMDEAGKPGSRPRTGNNSRYGLRQQQTLAAVVSGMGCGSSDLLASRAWRRCAP